MLFITIETSLIRDTSMFPEFYVYYALLNVNTDTYSQIIIVIIVFKILCLKIAIVILERCPMYITVSGIINVI